MDYVCEIIDREIKILENLKSASLDKIMAASSDWELFDKRQKELIVFLKDRLDGLKPVTGDYCEDLKFNQNKPPVKIGDVSDIDNWYYGFPQDKDLEDDIEAAINSQPVQVPIIDKDEYSQKNQPVKARGVNYDRKPTLDPSAPVVDTGSNSISEFEDLSKVSSRFKRNLIDLLIKKGADKTWVPMSVNGLMKYFRLSMEETEDVLSLFCSEKDVRVFHQRNSENKGDKLTYYTFSKDIPFPKIKSRSGRPKSTVARDRAQNFIEYLKKEGGDKKWLGISETFFASHFNYRGPQIPDMRSQFQQLGGRAHQLKKGSNKGWYYTLSKDVAKPLSIPPKRKASEINKLSSSPVPEAVIRKEQSSSNEERISALCENLSNGLNEFNSTYGYFGRILKIHDDDVKAYMNEANGKEWTFEAGEFNKSIVVIKRVT